MKLMQRLSLAFFILMLLTSIYTMAQSGAKAHTITKGETLSILAKKYHTTVGEIMRSNGMNSKSVLKVGQKIIIPVGKKGKEIAEIKKQPKDINQESINKASADLPNQVPELETTLTPKYYVVKKKETLFGISKKYKVSVDQIKSWNHIAKNNIHLGQKLIIAIEVTPIASKSMKVTPPANVEVKVPLKEVSTKELQNPLVQVASQEKKEVVVASNPMLPVIKKEAVVNPSNGDSKNVGGAEGFFATLYQQGTHELSGDAATFKTASGWLDKKYYVLINNVDAGTIVRISANNKTVVAKVLGPLPDIKEDNGLTFRISNAAASALGLADTKFNAVVSY